MAVNLQVSLMVLIGGTATKMVGLLNAKPLNTVTEAETFCAEVEATWDKLATVILLVPNQSGPASRIRITKAVLDQSIPIFTITQD